MHVMPEPITRTILERFDVPDSSYETVVMLVEMVPQVNSGLHTHPGFDCAYLLEGDLTVLEQGQADKPIRPGESWRVLPGSVHEVKIGDRTTKVLAIYVVERGKPLATPWPPQSN
jgi:quercetin dioxygenase-like cupin family protein